MPPFHCTSDGLPFNEVHPVYLRTFAVHSAQLVSPGATSETVDPCSSSPAELS